jgi:DNA-binding CsgD family transcriptional regulator
MRAGSWADAYEAFSRADANVPLSAPDLESWAACAYMLGREEEYEALLDRAHLRYLDLGDTVRAAYCVCWLALSLAGAGAVAQAGGWFARARRLIAGVDEETVVHGYLALADAMSAVAARRDDEAMRVGGRAVEIGMRFSDPNLTALALQLMGRVELRRGNTDAGLTLLDEAMVTVASGSLMPAVAGIVYCSVIDGCRSAYAIRRVHEWTEALTRWCERQPQLVTFTGECRVARAEMLVLRGDWDSALAEAGRAVERVHPWVANRVAAAAAYQRGEVARLRGDLAEAERAYEEAARAGGRTQPGLALLRLAQGADHVAAQALDRALGETTDPLAHARLLPAKVEVALARGQVEEARASAAELGEVAAAFGSQALQALADQAAGAVELAAGDAAAAAARLRRAVDAWHELVAPYEAARARALLGEAFRSLGDEEGAELELDAARAVFEELGARPDLERLEASSGVRAAGHGLSPRELEVLALLARGDTNRAIAGRLGISERTVDRHVSNIFDKLGVASRAEAAAYAARHGLG